MSPEVRAARRRLALRAAGAGLTWSVGLLLTALLVPLYDGQTSSDANGLTLSTATYVQRNGAGVLIPLVVALIAGVIVAVAVLRPAPRMRRAAVAVVAVLALLGLVLVTSGGILLLPVAILLAVALRLTRSAASGLPPGSGPGPARGASRAPAEGRTQRRRPRAPRTES